MIERVDCIRHPTNIPYDCTIAPHASDLYEIKRKEFSSVKKQNLAYDEHSGKIENVDQFKYETIKAGQNLVKEVNTPFIKMDDIALLQKDQIVDYVNKKFGQFEQAMPKLPTLYNWIAPDGDVVWSLDKERTSTQMITHYMPPVDIPQEQPKPNIKRADLKLLLDSLLELVPE